MSLCCVALVLHEGIVLWEIFTEGGGDLVSSKVWLWLEVSYGDFGGDCVTVADWLSCYRNLTSF